MTYNLFIDDERYPSLTPEKKWVIVRSYADAVDYMRDHGFPIHISFDHDLGSEKTGYDIVHWMIEQDLDGIIVFPVDFSYVVHSQNPIGAENIRGLLDSYLMHFRGVINCDQG